MTGPDTDLGKNFNFYDPEQVQNLHETYADMRSRCPVAHSEELDGFSIITRYEDVVAATLNTETFSSEYCLIPRDQFGPEFKDRPPLTLDPPQHTAFRKLLLPGFTAARVQRWEPVIRRVCKEALAAFTTAGGGDLSEDYSKKIPLGLICAMMGVSPEAEEQFNRWTHALIESADVDLAMAAAGEIAQFLSDRITEHEQSQADDLITHLMNSEIDGEKLSRPELLGALVLILIAGLDTVWNVLSSSLWHLAKYPEDRQRLKQDPSLIPTAVEEFLRFYAPVSLARVTTKETEVAGTKIGADEMVLLCWPSANRDPEEFPDADKVVLDRLENRHVTFGLGPHRCLGSSVARLELVVALEEFLAAVPDYELTDPDAVYWSTGHTVGPRNIQVKLGASATDA